ncbi:MAG: hypothetical protein L0207_01955 [Chlamydiae bacterium]|nr:hypothetical protein [Chlamydiota bacterium]
MKTIKNLFFLFFSLTFFHVEGSFPVDESDHYHFGVIWPSLRILDENGLLEQEIDQRRKEIAFLTNYWRETLHECTPSEDLELLNKIEKTGKVSLIQPGTGGTYLFSDEKTIPRFIVKPTDEAISCLNNPKHLGSPLSYRVLKKFSTIPLYRSSLSEVLAHEVSKILELETLVPKTFLAILERKEFHDILDHTQDNPIIKEKLCSVQEYIPNSICLNQLMKYHEKRKATKKEVLTFFDQSNFEDLMIFIWIIFDTDAHSSNIVAVERRPHFYQLYKFDNGHAFPERNEELRNILVNLPHAEFFLSQRTKEKILHIPVEKITDLFHFFGMGSSVEALLQRVCYLQYLVSVSNDSIRVINQKLSCSFVPQP